MGGRVERKGICPICEKTNIRELLFDKRDMQLKCEECYKRLGN